MPDTVRKLDEVLTTLLQAGQSAGDIDSQDVRDAHISASPPAFGGFGFYRDSALTIGAPLALVGGVRTLMPNNAVLESRTSDISGEGFTQGTDITLEFDPWDPVASEIVSNYPNEVMAIQLSFKSKTTSPNNFMSVEFDVGGPTPPFLNQTQLFAKGSGVETNFVYNWILFSGTDFFANGAQMFMTADGNADAYDFVLTIARIGRPYI